MKRFILISIVLIMLISNFGVADSKEGSLLMVGGALRADNDDVYKEFIKLAGGKENAKIGIVPVASGSPYKYTKLFKKDMVSRGLDKSQVELIPIAIKDDSRSEEIDESKWSENGLDKKLAKKVKKYTGIWFVGGDQRRITKTLFTDDNDKTPVLESIWEVYNNGGVIGGTSAGAAIMSEIMISGGDSFGALNIGHTDDFDESTLDYQNQGGLVIDKGLGFFKQGIIDQHFGRKGRLGRLIVTGYEHKDKYPINFGIEENTALVYKKDKNTLSVKGQKGIVIVDLRESIKKDNSYQKVKVGYLEGKDKFDLNSKTYIIDESKYTTTGYEYFNRKDPLVSGSVDADNSIKTTIAYNLVDNKEADEVSTYLFDKKGKGYQFKFYKINDTEGYWGQSWATDLYSFKNVGLDIYPVEVNISQLTEKSYTVKEGDVLWKIAEKFDTTVNKIAKNNSIDNINNIKVGEKLIIR